MSLNLPKWQCHKVVGASRIVNLDYHVPGPHMVTIETEHGSIPVSGEWVVKHHAEVGGFFVEYDDGYTSYSPAQAFIEGYMQLEIVQQGAPKCFEDALRIAINRYSKESGSDTPDFILAVFLSDCLRGFDNAYRERSKWYNPDRSDMVLPPPTTAPN